MVGIWSSERVYKLFTYIVKLRYLRGKEIQMIYTSSLDKKGEKQDFDYFEQAVYDLPRGFCLQLLWVGWVNEMHFIKCKSLHLNSNISKVSF